MKRVIAGLLTILILIVMTWTALQRPSSPWLVDAAAVAGPGDGDSPRLNHQLNSASDRIESLIESGRRGDVALYLAAFAGPLRTRLDREVHERGWAEFGEQLRRAGRARKSHAIFAPSLTVRCPKSPGSPSKARTRIGSSARVFVWSALPGSGS